MSKTEILEELPKLTKTERQEIRYSMHDWRPTRRIRDAGSTWEEVEERIRTRLSSQPNG